MATAPPADEQLERALRALDHIPVASMLIDSLSGMLGSADASVREIEKAILNDPALAGSIIKAANSAAVGSPEPVTNLKFAVMRLGTERLSRLVTSWRIARTYGSISPVKGWGSSEFVRVSIATGVVTSNLVRELKQGDPEAAFLAGFLAHLGLLLLAAGLKIEYLQIRGLYVAGQGTLSDCQKKILGFNHFELSKEAIRLIKLPSAVTQAVGADCDCWEPQPPASSADCLRAAVLLVEQMGMLPQPWLLPRAGTPAETLSRFQLGDRASALLTGIETELEMSTAIV